MRINQMKDPEDFTVEPSHTSNMTTAPAAAEATSLVQLDTAQLHHHHHPEEMSQWKVNILKLPKELRDLVAGGVAGMIAKSVVAPIDRIKILYQISAAEFRLHYVPNVVRKIVETEGVSALWKGNMATMIRVFPYAGIQFMVFARCKTYFLYEHQRDQYIGGSSASVDRNSQDHHSKKYGLTPFESLLAGMLAGAVSATATYPLDLTRAQLAVLRRHRHHHNLSFVQVFGDNVRKGGIAGLFRGLSPTVLGIIPYSGIAFALNEQGKRKIQNMARRDLTTIERLQCGAVSGLFAQTITYPLEVTRRRMQTIGLVPTSGNDAAVEALGLSATNASNEPAGRPHNMVETMKFLYKEQGMRGFFKGVSMNWMKGPVAFSISFTAFDSVQSLIETEPEKELRLGRRWTKR